MQAYRTAATARLRGRQTTTLLALSNLMALAEITAESEDGFADLRLTMVSLHCDPDGEQRLTARGLHNGRTVGFAVSLSSMWERQDVDGYGISLHWGSAKLISLGEESDAFLQALDEVYLTNLGHQRMRDQVSYVAVSLTGLPPHVGHEFARMKLFFEIDDEERRAEFYLDVDPQNSAVQFREKDTGYRWGVVLSLSADA